MPLSVVDGETSSPSLSGPDAVYAHDVICFPRDMLYDSTGLPSAQHQPPADRAVLFSSL